MKRCVFALVIAGLVLLPVPSLFAQELPEDPIGDIAIDMTVVVRDLSKLSTGKTTQEKQKTVVAKLDELIARLEKECEACKGGGAKSANPTRPLADSVIRGGPGGMGDLHSPRSSGKKWGELPAHQRDRILQSMTEGFPSHYQQILERYYKRLAEEKPASETDSGAKSDARPKPAADTPTAPAAQGAATDNQNGAKE